VDRAVTFAGADRLVFVFIDLFLVVAGIFFAVTFLEGALLAAVFFFTVVFFAGAFLTGAFFFTTAFFVAMGFFATVFFFDLVFAAFFLVAMQISPVQVEPKLSIKIRQGQLVSLALNLSRAVVSSSNGHSSR
jgi:hypothetical protein